MKNITIITLLITICFCFSFQSVLATNGAISGKLGTVGNKAGFQETSIAKIVGKIINAFLSILGIIFMSYMVYAGYLWLTSHGQEEKIEKAKAIIRGSIIGLIIIFAAWAITSFVISQIGAAADYNVGQ